MKNQDKIKLFNILIKFEEMKQLWHFNQQIEDKNENINIKLINGYFVLIFKFNTNAKTNKYLNEKEILDKNFFSLELFLKNVF